MAEALGFKVLKLVRTRVGPWSLDGLEVGKHRELNAAEIRRFRLRQSAIRRKLMADC